MLYCNRVIGYDNKIDFRSKTTKIQEYANERIPGSGNGNI